MRLARALSFAGRGSLCDRQRCGPAGHAEIGGATWLETVSDGIDAGFCGIYAAAATAVSSRVAVAQVLGRSGACWEDASDQQKRRGYEDRQFETSAHEWSDDEGR
jgi:hypothetical protein